MNLRDACVEVFREPEPRRSRYAWRRTARRGERIDLVALPEAEIAVDDLLPADPIARD